MPRVDRIDAFLQFLADRQPRAARQPGRQTVLGRETSRHGFGVQRHDGAQIGAAIPAHDRVLETRGSAISSISRLAGATFLPPEAMIMSFFRPVI